MLKNALQKLSPVMQRVVTGTLLIIGLAIVLAIGGCREQRALAHFAEVRRRKSPQSGVKTENFLERRV